MASLEKDTILSNYRLGNISIYLFFFFNLWNIYSGRKEYVRNFAADVDFGRLIFVFNR